MQLMVFTGCHSPRSRRQPGWLTLPRVSPARWFAVLALAIAALAANHSAIQAANDFFPPPQGVVRAVALLADGTSLVGGEFQSPMERLARYWPAGRLDATTLDQWFYVPARYRGGQSGREGTVFAFAEQADGQIIVGGDFDELRGEPRALLGRLDRDGRLDFSFSPRADATEFLPAVRALAVQADGKIVVGGSFTSLAGRPRRDLGRLNPDGTLDPDFAEFVSGNVRALAIQGDNSILVGGELFEGASPRPLVRLYPDGYSDPIFRGITATHAVPDAVEALAVQADGRILVGGRFTEWDGQPRKYLVRLSPTGHLDLQFDPRPNQPVHALAAQADGSVLVGGAFTQIQGVARGYLARVGADGLVDPSFDFQVNGPVLALAQRGDGSLTIAGDFTTVGGRAERGVARLANPGPAQSELTRTPERIVWRRSGACPEIRAAWFDYSEDGWNWHRLGEGVRRADGWEVPALGLSVRATVRARGFCSSGAGLVESASGPPAIVEPPANLMLAVGQRGARFHAFAVGDPPLTYQWRHDGQTSGNPAWASGTLEFGAVQASDVGQYQLGVSNPAGSVFSDLAWLTVNSAEREQGVRFGGGVQAMIVQPDGKVVVDGRYRLNPDFSLDPLFVRVVEGNAQALALQPDGKILVGGEFNSVDGTPRRNLARLQSNGRLDSGFAASANWPVHVLALLPDGRVLVGGRFTVINGHARPGLARLLASGALDPTFNPVLPTLPPVSDSIVDEIALQPDGKMLVGLRDPLQFVGLHFVRLQADGSPDAGFQAAVKGRRITLQPDGKLLVGDAVPTDATGAVPTLVRLTSDGRRDPTFPLQLGPGQPPSVALLALQADGRPWVATGIAASEGGGHWVRCLNPDGTPDVRVALGFQYPPRTVLQPDGRPLFASATQSRGPFGWGWDFSLDRHLNPAPAVDSLVATGSAITWLRGGSAPEVWRTTFESSGDGLNWSPLGPGKRIAGGWQLNGLTLPSGRRVRARGFVAHAGRSEFFVERHAGAPVVTSGTQTEFPQPGKSLTLAPTVDGTGPFTFQWLKAGRVLSDDADVSGTATASLTLASADEEDAGEYSLRVVNDAGSITRPVATLTFAAPQVARPPASLIVTLNEPARFDVVAEGTPPFTYQWRRNGDPLAGATASTLEIAHASAGDVGRYDVIVANGYGSVTSLPAELAVLTDGTDSDQDGMPDSWEREQQLDPASANDAAADADGDQVSNLDEFREQTDPRDRESFRARLSVEPGVAGTVSWNPGGASFLRGTEVVLTAQPDPGAVFLRWEGAVAGTQSTITLRLAEHAGVRAVFSRPFGGEPRAVPGVVEAEDFDEGGEGYGYHESDEVNEGGADYRVGGVDIASNGPGQAVSWTRDQEWLTYTINVTSAGWYRPVLRVASASLSDRGVRVEVAGGSMLIAIPGTGGSRNWVEISGEPVRLEAGLQVVRVTSVTSGFDLDSIEFVGGPFRPLSAASLEGSRELGVAFGRPLDPTTATQAGNFSVPGTTVSSAQLSPDGTGVLLRVVDLAGPLFKVRVRDLRDALGNGVVPDSEVVGQVLRQSRQDVGTAGDPRVAGVAFSPRAGDFDVLAGGTDCWNNRDGFHFVHQRLTGDFDLAVRVESLDAVNRWSKAGLMAREDLTAGSRNVALVVEPRGPTRDQLDGGQGQDFYAPQLRETANGLTALWNLAGANLDGPPYPNAWLRLHRQGSVFRAYRGADGQRWTLIGETTQALPATLYVGLATASHNNAEGFTALARYRGFTRAGLLAPQITTQPTDAQAATGAQAQFRVEATGTAPLRYQWEFNGAEIPGATDSALGLEAVQVSAAGDYRAVVFNEAGLGVSETVRLKVQTQLRVFAALTADGTALELRLTGEPGQRYRISSSPDLIVWSPVLDTGIWAGSLRMAIPRVAPAQTFYRVSLLR